MEEKEKKQIRKDKTWWKITKFLFFFLVLFLLALGYSHYIAPHTLKTVEKKIASTNLKDSFHGLKVVQFSDIHYGRSVTEKDLLRISKEINRLKPDILVFTGDLFEHGFFITNKDQEILTSFLNRLEATYGKYAITGEDDYSVSSYPILLENGGFQLLDEKSDIIYSDSYDSILIAGMSTSTHGTKNPKDKIQPIIDQISSLEVLTNEDGTTTQNLKKPCFRILLLHEADVIQEIDYSKFDLVLAGHSHLGQVRIPIIGGLYYPKLSKSLKNSYYKFENTDLYISAGLGTTKVPFRFFNTPEINLYRITN